MLRKTKEQGSINFLGNNGSLPDIDSQTQKQSMSEDERILKVAEEQKSKRYNGIDDGYKNDKSIMSATCSPDAFSDMRGPNKQVHSSIGNSIWESDRLLKMKGEIDSKEASKVEKDSVAQLRKQMKQDSIDTIVEGIQSSTTKAADVTKMDSYQGHKFNSPQNGMSIFDSSDFARVPEKTAGEVVAEDNAQKRAQKDESWKNNGKAFSSKDVTSRLFDGLLNNLENKKD
jgi:hypothetical protein